MVRKTLWFGIRLLVLAVPAAAPAIPRFAVRNGTTCVSCHVNPSGGGLRNDHGTSVVSTDELPFRAREGGAVPFPALDSEVFRVGGDLRWQTFASFDDGDSVWTTALFPMQAEAYGRLRVTPSVELHAEVDLLRSNSELWAVVTPGKGIALHVGKKVPDYGLALDDHTAFTRGGNLRRRRILKKERLPFKPTTPVPGMAELSITRSRVRLSASIANRYALPEEPEYGLSEKFRDKSFTGRAEYFATVRGVGLVAGGSAMKEGDFFLRGLFGGMGWRSLALLAEADRADGWNGDWTDAATMVELSWEPWQGIQFVARHDRMDEDIDSAGRAVARQTLGAEIFPVQFLEIKGHVRRTVAPSGDEPPEFLMQLHAWF